MTFTELETLAKAATPGEWSVQIHTRFKHAAGKDIWRPEGRPSFELGAKRDAEFIAAANPETVLALIADLRRAREALDYIYRHEEDIVLRDTARAALDAMEVKP